MKTRIDTSTKTHVARPLAAEDLRRGDFVSVLYELLELPSYLWTCDPQTLPPDELIRIRWRPSDGGTPLKIKAICLPFVFVKTPAGKHRTLDVRQHELVRLSPGYAESVWKAMSREARARRASPLRGSF